MLDSNMNQEVLSAAVIDSEQPCVLVLAAGRGERFLASGGSSHKLHAMLPREAVLVERTDGRVFTTFDEAAERARAMTVGGEYGYAPLRIVRITR